MNKEYTYIDGKAIIKDEQGNQTPIEYYDNLDEVLIQENLIEAMEKRISQLEKENSKYKNKKEKPFIPVELIITAVVPLLSPLIQKYFGNTEVFVTTINTIYGPVNEALFYILTFSTIFIPLGTLLSFYSYRNYKHNIKTEKGIVSELNFLKEQIVYEKEILEELKQEKKQNNENPEFRVVQVNDKDKLARLNEWKNFFFTLGYDIEKYYRYYEKGKLEEKLKRSCSDLEIELASEYIKENGPTLIKRKNKK